MRASVKGEQQAVAFGRAMPHETIFKAIAVMSVSTLLVAIITILMTFFSDGDLFYVIFEVISAFSNTGYSLGLTGDLSTTGKLLRIAQRVLRMAYGVWRMVHSGVPSVSSPACLEGRISSPACSSSSG